MLPHPPSQKQLAVYKSFIKKLKAKPPRNLDDSFHELHEQVFEQTDCLACGNCCKTTSPMFLDSDIERLARYLKMRPSVFAEKYLMLDADGFQVLKSSPCAFLGADNYCAVYEARPKACREYPHTNRRRMSQLLSLTYENTKVCPAVAQIVDKLEQVYAKL
jgi:uncharacterized protein